MSLYFASLILLCGSFLSLSTYAFDMEKCSRAMPKAGAYIFGLPFSISSFISSTGSCAMIGEASYDRKVFIAYNLDKIQVDAARGGGEYLSVMASLYSCNSSDAKVLFKLMQENYGETFDHRNNGQDATSEIDRLVNEFESKIRSCKV